ncbi:hypothetical protein [Paraburkholderia jirisanensis]
MKIKLTAIIIAAALSGTAFSAFASGYGPAPFYRPSVGAPASQRGVSTQTLHAEAQDANEKADAYGGVRDDDSQAGKRAVGSGNTTSSEGWLYRHH